MNFVKHYKPHPSLLIACETSVHLNEVWHVCLLFQVNKERKNWAELMCKTISEGNLFAECRDNVAGWEVYLSDCMFDSCGCDRGGDCECMCTAIANFATACSNAGYPVKWRSQGLCRKCNAPATESLKKYVKSTAVVWLETSQPCCNFFSCFSFLFIAISGIFSLDILRLLRQLTSSTWTYVSAHYEWYKWGANAWRGMLDWYMPSRYALLHRGRQLVNEQLLNNNQRQMTLDANLPVFHF